MIDTQLFIVQPQLSQDLTDGITAFVYNKQAISQCDRDNPSLGEELYNKMAEQMQISDLPKNSEVHLMPIGNTIQAVTSTYGRFLQSNPTARQLISSVNFSNSLLILRVDTQKLSRSFIETFILSPDPQDN